MRALLKTCSKEVLPKLEQIKNFQEQKFKIKTRILWRILREIYLMYLYFAVVRLYITVNDLKDLNE